MRGRFLLSGILTLGLIGVTAAAAPADQLARLNLTETQLSAEQAHNRHQLARLLSVLEQLKRNPPPALLVSSQDAMNAVRAAILVKAITPELQDRAQKFARDASELMRLRRLAAVQNEAMFERESRAAEARPEPSERTDLALQGLPRTTRLQPPGSLTLPTPGPVLRRFGGPLAGGGLANGMTLAATRGATVVSPGEGIVQYVGPVKGWDVILILRLAGGYHLVLAGLENSSVKVGQSVAQGQRVGRAANGRQSTSELYLEVREQGTPVDPARWLIKADAKPPPRGAQAG